MVICALFPSSMPRLLASQMPLAKLEYQGLQQQWLWLLWSLTKRSRQQVQHAQPQR
jgi:hypothetical protein